jgi:hypothetical protein
VHLLDQAVEDSDLIAPLEQLPGDGSTDESGAARDQHFFPQRTPP